MKCTLGPKPLLEKAVNTAGMSFSMEAILHKYCVEQSRRGFPLMKDNLFALVKKLLETEKLTNPFKSGTPGKTWFHSFLRRHPDLAQKRAEHHSLARAAVKESCLRGWFAKVLTYAKESGHLSELSISSRVLNADETPFRISEISGMHTSL